MADPIQLELPSAGGVTLAAYRWEPAGDPRAVARLAHGMGEHARRYQHLAEALTDEGYVVYAQDHRGHGATAGSEAELGQVGAEGWDELVADIGRLGDLAREAYPGLPHALVAHSMGSFAAQQWLLDHSDEVDAVVLSGTAGIDLLEPSLDLDVPLDLSAFNAPFEPARTDFDWLSRDEQQVDRYVEDPWCGFGLDPAAGRQMFVGARRLADPDAVAGIRDDLSVLVSVGEKDPVNGGLALVEPLLLRLQGAGLTDVTLRTWPDARHEIFNETNREEVVGDVVAWLRERVG